MILLPAHAAIHESYIRTSSNSKALFLAPRESFQQIGNHLGQQGQNQELRSLDAGITAPCTPPTDTGLRFGRPNGMHTIIPHLLAISFPTGVLDNMASTHRPCRPLLSLWICIASFNLAFAQLIGSTNDSSTLPPPGSPPLVLKTSQTSMVSMVNVAPLTQAAGLQATVQQLQVSPRLSCLGIFDHCVSRY